MLQHFKNVFSVRPKTVVIHTATHCGNNSVVFVAQVQSSFSQDALTEQFSTH